MNYILRYGDSGLCRTTMVPPGGLNQAVQESLHNRIPRLNEFYLGAAAPLHPERPTLHLRMGTTLNHPSLTIFMWPWDDAWIIEQDSHADLMVRLAHRDAVEAARTWLTLKGGREDLRNGMRTDHGIASYALEKARFVTNSPSLMVQPGSPWIRFSLATTENQDDKDVSVLVHHITLNNGPIEASPAAA